MSSGEPAASLEPSLAPPQVALLGNPNTGKTTLFNRLCGARAHTGNYPGVTVDTRFGQVQRGGHRLRLTDLPGVYGLTLRTPESELCRRVLAGGVERAPDAAVVVADASHLARNLVLVGEVIASGRPTAVAVNMIDVSRARGARIDTDAMALHLGCPVVAVSARTGEGIEALLEAIAGLKSPARPERPVPQGPEELAAWARSIVDECVEEPAPDERRRSRADRTDHLLTDPLFGLPLFAVVMTGLFMSIFLVAEWPMNGIELIFAELGGFAGRLLPEGALRDLVVDGVIMGIAGTVVFVPQIFLLFFLIPLLEDTGYLARAAFVIDRVLRRFGLPGQAFVPLLSSHACAIPGIMATRLIPDRWDRLATILVAPFMSCSARLPVYVLLISFLFGDDPWLAGLAFAGCYLLGAAAALGTAFLARRTFLRGRARPMALELPGFKLPSLRTALLTASDRSLVFLRKAGTVILGICIIMWWLSAYPKSAVPDAAVELRNEAAAVAASDAERAADLRASADRLEARNDLAGSFAGRLGHTVEPVFAPLGQDWQTSIAILTSFLAREVFVSSLTVIVGTTEDDPAVLATLRNARRDDGTPLLTPGSAASLLVFYVLAMQCLPTLAVTRRETGAWRWALLQLGYMSALAYALALLTRLGLGAVGIV